MKNSKQNKNAPQTHTHTLAHIYIQIQLECNLLREEQVETENSNNNYDESKWLMQNILYPFGRLEKKTTRQTCQEWISCSSSNTESRLALVIELVSLSPPDTSLHRWRPQVSQHNTFRKLSYLFGIIADKVCPNRHIFIGISKD